MLPLIARYGCLLLLLAAACNAAPRINSKLQTTAETLDAGSSVEVLSRERRNGGHSNYWWIPGGTGSSQTYGFVSCGNPGRPRFGNSLFESVQAGALVVHSCIPGYKLIGAKLRLCQSNGQWTPQLPLCVYVDCGDPGAPANGNNWISSTALNSIVKYTCDQGFRLVGNSFRVCQPSGQWSGSLPTCARFGCPNLQAPVNGRISVKTSGLGAAATYFCHQGYQLVGTKTLTCQNGIWQGETPVCKVIDCGPLEAPRYGRVSIRGTTFGSLAFYECSRGFTLVGEDTRTCQSNGEWSGREPTCRALDCGQLSDIDNGRVIVTSTAVRSTARYVCTSGYTLVGSETRRCRASGRWSGREPRCELVSCSRLSAPDNGQVRLSGREVGSTATYSCNTGYVLEGKSVRVCQSSGEWSGEEPFCRLVDCDGLENPENGQVTFAKTTFGSTATYQCDSGFLLVGVAVRTCQADGFWSDKEPECEPRACSDLSNPRNGRVFVTGTSPGSLASYVCNAGFQLQGARSRTCLVGGEWSRDEPTCIGLTCRQLDNPENGEVVVEGTTVGSTATYSCNEGYLLVGVATRTCQANGFWSGSAPTCQAVFCGLLENPPNGDVTLSGAVPGSVATYTCNRGFILVGSATRTCRENSRWSGRAPMCQPVECEDLESPENGQVVLTGMILGSIATYTCFPGFELVTGDSIRTCLEDGQWSGRAPTCKSVDCGPLRDIPFGSVSLTGTLFGSVATYTCDPGYFIVGGITRICRANGQWSGEEPVCDARRCGSLDPPRGGRVVVSGTVVGSTATYSCLLGYTLVGEEVRTCQPDGMWSGSAPFCRGVTCPLLEAPENGRIVVTGTEVGDRASYSCLPGFQLQGVEVRTCQDNGEWAYEEPICVATQCPDLPNPTNGRVVISGNTFGSTATYRCRRGYGLIGISVRICQAEGTWSGTAPTCEISDCRDLEPPANGNIETTGTNFWDTATYSCNPGYVVVGEETRTCEANGFWNGTAPFCAPVECSLLDPPKDGRVSLTSTSFGAVARYVCLDGFELVGDLERTCQENGQWSGPEPVCERVECDLLPVPKNGDISFSQGIVFGSLAIYFCDPPYQVEGTRTRVCMANGEWSGEAPRCEALECPELDAPENGEVELSGRVAGTTATYTCDDGFVLVGSAVRTCQGNGFWTGVTPLCQPSGCETLKPPDNGDVQLTGNSVGSSATYSCDEGFSFVGGKVRVCLESGEWSGEEPTCSGISCEDLSDPENGVVELTGQSFRDTATYSCNIGYVLFGKGIRECRRDGQWNGEAPACRIVDCGRLADPVNGEVTFTGTTFGYTATYHCNVGFRLFGFSARVCQVSGDWSGQEPTCRSTTCADLDDPENGQVTLTGTSFGDTATFSCDFGYMLSGTETRSCMADGQWSNRQPTCNPADCSEPPVPDNGRFLLSSGTAFGSVATYSCNPGYNLVGVETRTCRRDETWSGTTPTCQIVDCGTLPAPENGNVIIPDTVFGSEVVYHCLSDFTLVGVETRSCQADGTWFGAAPFCIRNEDFQCSPLTSPENGIVEVAGTRPGARARYTCNTGFQLEGGNSVRRCVEGTGWSGTAPICTPVDCGPLTSPLNGHVMTMGTTLDSTALYSCLEGYLLLGSVTRTCEADGLWSGNEPICSPVECGNLPSPLYGVVTTTGIQLGAVARYFCNEGFALQGDATRTCESEGTWSGVAPTCERIAPDTCGDPGTPENGIRIGDDFRIGATVYYECNDGFGLVGPDSRTCRPDGFWSGFLPNCTEITVGGCTGEGIVIDACLRRCTCEDGQFVDCCRVRVDYASLSVEERRRYINTVVRLATDPEFKPRYDALVSKYKASFDTLAQNTDPRVSQFFAWHRYFLLEYENLLQEVDCRVTIPYWDWTALPANPYMSPIWNPDSGFGDSSRGNDSCVSNGPFRYDLFAITPSAGKGCLQRQYRMQMFPTRAIVEQDLLTLPPEDFDQFHQFLQIFIHTNVRCFVGGQMCSEDAANDPAYITHLARIDSIFTRWQEIDEAHLSVRLSTDNRPLALANGLTVSQFSNTQNLPNNISICYNPADLKDHIPPSMIFLTSALEEMTENRNIHMECIGDEDMEEVHMSTEATEFMHEMCNN